MAQIFWLYVAVFDALQSHVESGQLWSCILSAAHCLHRECPQKEARFSEHRLVIDSQVTAAQEIYTFGSPIA